MKGLIFLTAAELKYLIAINELSDGPAGVRQIEVAEKMGVSKVSAHKAAERLEHDGCIMRSEKNRIIITCCGYDRLGKYGILVRWLSGHLMKNCGVSADTAYSDAIGAVCAFSEESIQKLTEHIEKTMKKGEENDR